jgi:hypothetical protein
LEEIHTQKNNDQISSANEFKCIFQMRYHNELLLWKFLDLCCQ